MEMTLPERLEKLLNAYSHHYDIYQETTVADMTFPASAVYFLRDENYIVSKRHVLNAVENHEYVYFYLTERLDTGTLRHLVEVTREDGLGRIVPSKEHMTSFVTLVILADVIDPEAKKVLKRTRFRKNYRLALHGWMEYHIAAMETATRSFLSNPAGREARRTLELNFGPKVK